MSCFAKAVGDLHRRRKRQEFVEARFIRPVVGREGVEEGRNADFLPDCLDLSGHLKRDYTPKRESPKIVRTFTLDISDLLDVMCCHVLNPCMAALLSIETSRLQGINRLIRSQAECQIAISQNLTTDT